MTTTTAIPAVDIPEPELLSTLVDEMSAPLTGLVGAGVGVTEVVLEDMEPVRGGELDVDNTEGVDCVAEDDSVKVIVDVGAADVSSDGVELS